MQVCDDDWDSAVAVLGRGTHTVTRADGKVARLQLEQPVALTPGAPYKLSLVAKGADSFVGEDCLAVIVAGGVRISVECYESHNGTNEMRGQFPELFIRPLQ